METTDPQPTPAAKAPNPYAWPRPEVRHLIATLPETSMGRWRDRTNER